MIALYIIGTVVLITVVVLMLPLKVNLKFCEDFSLKVKFAFITLYKTEEKQETKQKETIQKTQVKKESLFQKLKSKNGFTGAIKEIFAFLGQVFEHLKVLFRFVWFKNVNLNLSVAGEDAAQTAIKYGAVCSVVYPVLSFFDSIANVKYKRINVQSNFDSKESEFDFSLDINLQILVLIIAGFKIYKEYKKFSVRNGLQ